MKKMIAVLFAFCLVLSTAACTLSGGSSKLEQQYVEKIQQLLDSGDNAKAQGALEEALKRFPESAALLELQKEMDDSKSVSVEEKQTTEKDDLTAVSEAAQPIRKPTIPEVETQVRSLRQLYGTWFVPNAVSLDYTQYRSVQVPSGTSGTRPATAYVVNQSGMMNKSSLDALFLEYCTPEMLQSFALFNPHTFYNDIAVHYLDIDGKLYCALPDQYFSITDSNIQVEEAANDTFLITFDSVISFAGNYNSNEVLQLANCSMLYIRTEKGYRFDNLKMLPASGTSIVPGNYIVATKGADLMIHSAPNNDKESRIGAVKKNTVVYVENSVNGWAYIYTPDNQQGWVSSDYLVHTDAAENAQAAVPRTTRPSGTNSDAEIINGLINGGLQIAEGVLQSIF